MTIQSTAPAASPGGVQLPKTPSRPNWTQQLRPVLRRNGLIIFFGVLLLVFAAVRPEFLSEGNIRNILLSASVIGILAIGQTVVMLTGGFDLAVARTAVVAGMVVGLVSPLGMFPAIALAVFSSIIVGLISGTLISRAKVNPFVVTLGMYTILTSVALLINDGGSVSNLPGWLTGLTSSKILGVSSIVFWFIGIAIAAHIVLAHTRFGRHIYAIGGNFEASRLAGIKVNKVLTIAYIVCAVCAGIAGILLTARLQTASPVALPGAELDAIAAVIIGGTRLSGGFGSVPRTIVGVLILASLSSGLVLLGVAAYWQGLVKGAVIILAVAVDVIFNKRN
jgi:ribose/xylose/arabinose/galactoside ABC-type transport system permease subunit